MPLSPGTRLGPYEVVAPLGAGAMGEVYRARDTRLGREIALKVLPGAFATDPERLRRFELEARAVGGLNHPNIVVLYDIGTSEAGPYLVTELLDGSTLRARLDGRPMAVARVVEIACAIAEGLAAAHAHGIVHRDLKPENVFLLRDGRVKVLDFGIAKLARREPAVAGGGRTTVASQTESYVLTGTASYMSPEQARGEMLTPASDLFALGVLIHEMLTGRNPFARGAVLETLHAILHDEPPPLPEPLAVERPGLQRVLRRALAKPTAERFESARDLAFALRLAAESPGGPAVEIAPPPALGVHDVPYHRLTFRRGQLTCARYAPDGKAVVYGARWEGLPVEIFWATPGSNDARPLDLGHADLFSVSRFGELAVSLGHRHMGGFVHAGTLARVPLGGRSPRRLLEGVQAADWGPTAAAMAVVREDQGRARLEYPAGKVVFETAGWISFPRVSPDGSRVAFLDHPLRGNDAGLVRVVEPDGQVRVLAGGWESLWGCAWTPGGREVWFSGTKEGAVRAVHAVTLEGEARTVLRLLGTTVLHDISPAGDVLLTHGQDRLGMQIVFGEETAARDLSWLDWSLLRAIDPDGTTVLFDESGEGASGGATIYMRGTDGSPATQIGEGLGLSLSPDRAWVLAFDPRPRNYVRLLPVGLGEPRRVDTGELEPQGGLWHPDGRSLLLAGTKPGEPVRLYRCHLDSGTCEPVAPPGVGTFQTFISPDGRSVAASDSRRVYAIYPLEGGEPRPIPGLQDDERLVHWSADGRYLYSFNRMEIPPRVWRIDLQSGERTFVREVGPADRTGVLQVGPVLMAENAGAFAFSYLVTLGDLFHFEGLARS